MSRLHLPWLTVVRASVIGSTALLLAAFLVGCATPPPVPLTWSLPEGVHTESVNGYPMAYVQAGTGPSVVLVHGVLCDYRCMAAQVRGLSDQYTVRAVSLRHFYPEPWQGQGSDFSLMQHVRDLAAFLERSRPPVNLVGWSYGAHVAYEVARTRPELVKRLVLAEAPTDSLIARETANANAIRQKRAADTAEIYRSGDMERGIEFAIDAISGPGSWSRAPAASKAVVRGNAWTVVGIGRDDPPIVRCEDLGALKMPVLLIVAQNTTQRFKDLVAAQSRCLPSARVVTIPDAGHPSPLQNPAAFNEAVRNFLQ